MITIRRAVLPGDPAEAFCLDTWVRSFLDAARGGRDEAAAREPLHAILRDLPDDAAASAVRSYVSQVARSSKIYVATPADDPNLFLGWISVSGPVLHYIYVKRRVRKAGLASQLIQHAVTESQQPLTRTSLISWPWVEGWLRRNGVVYAPRSSE